MTFRDQLANLWSDIMRLPVEAFFRGKEHLMVVDPAGHGCTASPGYVGRNYRPGGWLLVGNYPAGGTTAYGTSPDLGDADLYRSLQALQASTCPTESRAASEHLWDTWIRVQHRHRMYQTVVRALLVASEKEDHDVAFINRFPFRVQGNAGVRASMEDAAWNLAVDRQIRTLEPGMLIALGVATGQCLEKRYSGRARIWVLPRSNGDYALTKLARSTILRIAGVTKGPEIESLEDRAPGKARRAMASSTRVEEPAVGELPGLSSSSSHVIERILRELGFHNIEVRKVLKHAKPIPSLYYNRDGQGVVYFTGRRKDEMRYLPDLWIEVDPRQSKDKDPNLMTMRPRQGRERMAIASILETG